MTSDEKRLGMGLVTPVLTGGGSRETAVKRV